MFGWFKRKKDPSVFTVGERKIYHYFDGKRTRDVDPMPIYKAIMAKAPSLSIDMKVAASISKDNIRAHTAYIVQLREIFAVKPYEQGGLEENELEKLFLHFWEFVTKELKNECSPTTTTATEALPNTESTSGANQPTPNGSDSTSTSSENETSKPTQSPSESESPLVGQTPA